MCVRETLGERRDWTYRPNQDVIVHQDKTLSFFFLFSCAEECFLFLQWTKEVCKTKTKHNNEVKMIIVPAYSYVSSRWLRALFREQYEQYSPRCEPLWDGVHRLSPALLLQSANRTNHQRMRLFGGELIFQTTFSTSVVYLLDLNHSALFRHKIYNHNSHASLQRPSQRFPKTK